MPLEILNAPAAESRRSPSGGLTEAGIILDEELARLELSYMESALKLKEGWRGEAWKLLGVHHRFSFRRRAKTLLKSFPHLAHNYRTVSSLYLQNS